MSTSSHAVWLSQLDVRILQPSTYKQSTKIIFLQPKCEKNGELSNLLVLKNAKEKTKK